MWAVNQMKDCHGDKDQNFYSVTPPHLCLLSSSSGSYQLPGVQLAEELGSANKVILCAPTTTVTHHTAF